MESLAETASRLVDCEPTNYDEASMQESLVFSDSLKDLKNLRKQLYSAAEYFEHFFTNDDQKNMVVSTLKDYAVKALVNTVDHLGSVSYKVYGLIDEEVDEVSRTELRISCIQQKLRTCQDYIDREGLSQQSLVINTPNYHKRYILPLGETMHGAVRTKSKYQGCSLEDRDQWHQFKNAIRSTMKEIPPAPELGKGHSPSPPPKLSQQGQFSISNKSIKDSERRTASPLRFPLFRSGSLSLKPTIPRSSRPSTPNQSRLTTSIRSMGRPLSISEPRKSSSMRTPSGKESLKEAELLPSKSKRLLKSLLSRRKMKKDDMLYTYLDEY